MVAAAAVNVALVPPAAILTDAGTVSKALPLDSVTVVPPASAAPDNPTVQVLAADEANDVGEQASEDTVIGASREMVAVCEELPAVAVTTALWLLGMAPAVAVNVALVPPAAILTDAGTVSKALPLERVTVVPPAGAAPDNPTVQVLEPADDREPGEQLSEDTVIGLPPVIVMLPGVPDTAYASAAIVAPRDPDILICVELIPDATVTVAVATTPFEITFALIPERIHW